MDCPECGQGPTGWPPAPKEIPYYMSEMETHHRNTVAWPHALPRATFTTAVPPTVLPAGTSDICHQCLRCRQLFDLDGQKINQPPNMPERLTLHHRGEVTIGETTFPLNLTLQWRGSHMRPPHAFKSFPECEAAFRRTMLNAPYEHELLDVPGMGTVWLPEAVKEVTYAVEAAEGRTISKWYTDAMSMTS